MPKQKQIYVPIKPENVRISVEVPVKEIGKVEIIETPGQKTKLKRKEKKTVEIKREKKQIIKQERKKDGYILIITEKPQAALKIASSLGTARKLTEGGASYYELVRDGKKIVVGCAVGHLFGLKQEKGEKGWPIFKIKWEASFEKNTWAKKYYLLLKKLVKGASEFVVATDYDIEGEVIGYNIIRFIAFQEDAKRMKFSTLTKQELEKAYDNLMPTIDWGQAIAGEARHVLDWLYGINLSRGLMEAIKMAGNFRIMSIGRVQGPALNIIVEKEKQIQNFKPEPYWQVFITIEGIELKYIKDITNKNELPRFENLVGKKAEVSTEKSEQHIRPPAPFDLTTLQTEAYKFFGINPSRTLQIAQALYLAGMISYPRTSSQKIPEAINPKEIIKRLSSSYPTSFCKRGQPIEGSKSDPAHPSIYPTGEKSELEGDEFKIYDLIARRFLSCFCEDAITANKTITALVGELKFNTRGLAIVKKAWMEIYKAKMEERELPDLNGTYVIENSKIEEKMTQPPRRYTPASLVAELAKRNLGTKATRASIIETLYSRGYVKDQSIKATPLGISLIDTLEKHSPIIIDEELTRNYEKEMDLIQATKKNVKGKEQKVIDDAKRAINKIAEEFKKDEMEIGKELVLATNSLRQAEKEENTLDLCRKCKKNNLRIMFNRNYKRYFVGCSGYPECKTTFSLPPNALIKKSDKTCKECGFPMLLSIKKGRRPWEFCFNPECPTRQQKQTSEQDNQVQ